MNFTQWLHEVFGPQVQLSRACRGKSRQPVRPRYVPRLEWLEDRLTPATHPTGLVAHMVVNTAHDETNTPATLSLREALELANGSLSYGALPAAEKAQVTLAAGNVSTITFDSSLDGSTLTLSTVGDVSAGPSALLVESQVRIEGPTGNNGITLSAAGTTMRLFDVTSTGNLTLQNLTLRSGTAQGHAHGSAGLGGAIFNQGKLTILDSTLTGNTAQGGAGGAGMGGAVFNEAGSVVIINSTFTANTASGGTGGEGLGGGLFNHNGSITVTNSTFSLNTAAQGGRGIFNLGDSVQNTTASTTATAVITNTIIGQSDVSVSDLVVDQIGTGSATVSAGSATVSGRTNLIRTISVLNGATSNLKITLTTDPRLAALGYYGGPTPTMALLSDSPAIDNGTKSAARSTDQRGFTRDPDNAGSVDIGAYERVAGIDLALKRPAFASSVESMSFPASNAVDGNSATRWSSKFSDPQWIYVDLGATFTITEVKLNWEVAAGKNYQIQVSSDAINWTTIDTITGNTTAGVHDYKGLSGTGRYVRVYGTARATQFSYSLYSFQVYASP
jgi:hypothetical protein